MFNLMNSVNVERHQACWKPSQNVGTTQKIIFRAERKHSI